jgi:hypothetical protein
MSCSKQSRSKLVAPLRDNPNQTQDAEIQTAKGGRLLVVIGCSYWGAKHIRVSCDMRDARMSMAADLRPDRLEYIHSPYPSVAVSRDIAMLEAAKHALARSRWP